MVFSYYCLWAPYKIAWGIAKLFSKKKRYYLHLEDPLDYYLFANIEKHLDELRLVADRSSIIPKLKELVGKDRKIYRYPFCFPDGVIMFRNAAWKYPVKRMVKIGLQHGAYSFKRFPKAYYFNMFDIFLMTSEKDVRELKAKGVRTVKAIGYPKSDSLLDGSYTPEYLKSLRDKLKLDKDKLTILFSATWDGSGMSAIHKWYNRLNEIADSYNIIVIVHSRMSESYKASLRQVKGISFIEEMNIYPYLLLADVFIGDTSSIIAEFCIVNRPLITFSIKPTERTLPATIELIKAVSLQIDDFEELPQAIELALKQEEEMSKRRREAISIMIEPLDGKAGQRAAEEIVKHLPQLKRQ